MEMGLIQACDLLQVVAWLLTVHQEPDYLFPSVLHPFWQLPWSVSGCWDGVQGLQELSLPPACVEEKGRSCGCSRGSLQQGWDLAAHTPAVVSIWPAQRCCVGMMR